MPAFNNGDSATAEYFKNMSKKVVLVDMNSELGIADLSDGLHPTTDGYAKMATAFLRAIDSSPYIISNPPTSSEPYQPECKVAPVLYNAGQIANGFNVYVSRVFGIP